MPHDSSDLPPVLPEQGHPLSPVPARRTPAWSSDGQAEPAPRTAAVHDGPHRTLRLLRRAGRRQRRVAAFIAVAPFALFLVLTVEVPSLMTRPAPGGLPTGLLLALVQLPVTWLAVLLYEWTARRYVDPLARRARGYDRQDAHDTQAAGRPS
ncbi:DUF485 domain-containing protein [Streptomyces griseoviridis]|uniref:DUF485 domain-containing protein n=1 Tax=Streptomyces griseoviridis TaxID=45398 RepID=A0A3S9Z604_STRGD|nr:DUF485 domain-containing protein [Streptomyces griseoviridis]AZS83099.1 DUF485 domain-containing protein [Streptomyces griseoviridis]QCN90047.1 DUF485 domain-containing protein [Streptomyces griseoviridis]